MGVLLGLQKYNMILMGVLLGLQKYNMILMGVLLGLQKYNMILMGVLLGLQKYNVILMGVLLGLQKSNFLHRQSLYPGNTVSQEVHLMTLSEDPNCMFNVSWFQLKCADRHG
jgi:hypothetical protein